MLSRASTYMKGELCRSSETKPREPFATSTDQSNNIERHNLHCITPGTVRIPPKMKEPEGSVSQNEGFTSGGTFQKISAAEGNEIVLRAIDGYDTELRAINKKVSEKKR